MITLLWAQTKSGVIGNNGILPWNIAEEMKHFITYTTDKKVLMGRKTWDSLHVKPLKNRDNFVVSNQKLDFSLYNRTYLIKNLDDFLTKWSSATEEIVVIGGLSIYKTALKFAKKIVVSIIKDDFDGDTIMCDINYDEFVKKVEIDADEFKVIIYERK